LSFALISSDESQSKAKFNLQSLGEKKTSYRAENRFFPKGENFKSTFVNIDFLYPPDNALLCKAILVR